MTALVLEWQRVDAVRVGWVPQPAGPAIPAAIVGPPGQDAATGPREPVIAPGTAAQYWRGDKTWVTLDKAAVALGNADDTSDAAKPVSTAQATAIAAKLNAAAVSTWGLTLIDDVDAATARTTLGLGTLATQSGTFSGTHSGTSSGTNTGDQTTITGNAGSATVLQTARTINGVAFNGSANVTINAVDATARVPDTRTVATTAPLAGGGTLSGNLTLSIGAASGSAAGSLSSADFTKLAGVATGATANSPDATLLARANHTGTQAVATITGNWPVAQLNGGTGASATTFWRGDGSWAAPTATVADGSIANVKLADVATATIKGRGASGTGAPTDLTVAQVHALLDNRFWGFQDSDFHQSGTATTHGAFVSAAISSGTVSTAAVATANHPGIIRLNSSTTANSGVRVQTAEKILLGGGEICDVVLNTPAAFANTTIRLGYLDTVTSSDALDGAYFEVGATGVVTGKTASNSTRTTSSTIATLSASTWYHFRVSLDAAATTATFEIFSDGGVSQGSMSITTNIPTATGRETQIGLVATNSGTTATVLCDLDYMRFGSTRKMVRGAV